MCIGQMQPKMTLRIWLREVAVQAVRECEEVHGLASMGEVGALMGVASQGLLGAVVLKFALHCPSAHVTPRGNSEAGVEGSLRLMLSTTRP